jgi:recombinational DNA repair protein RecT
MAQAATKVKPKEEQLPEAQKEPSKARALVQTIQDHPWEELPPHINRERFVSAALACLRQTSDIGKATTNSVKAALIRAAQDGLLPDGREGVITVFKDQAAWNPMIYGLRKRGKELENLIVDAQAFYENDTDGLGILVEQGDEPRIVHRIDAKSDRGKLAGAYAIFRRGGEIIHREYMGADEIEKTRQQSRAPDSIMWKKFPEEAYRKTVARRGFKSVPATAALQRIIEREDENFDFNQAPPQQLQAHQPARSAQDVVRAFAAPASEVTEIEVSGDEPVGEPFDKEMSTSNLSVLCDAIKKAESMERLKEVVGIARNIVPRMLSEHQNTAQAELTKRAMELAEDDEGSLPSFFDSDA